MLFLSVFDVLEVSSSLMKIMKAEMAFTLIFLVFILKSGAYINEVNKDHKLFLMKNLLIVEDLSKSAQVYYKRS